MLVCNDFFLPIYSHGSTIIRSIGCVFDLQLHDLIYVQKLCIDNAMFIEFHVACVLNKVGVGKKILTQGIIKVGFYSLKSHVQATPYINYAFSIVKTTSTSCTSFTTFCVINYIYDIIS